MEGVLDLRTNKPVAKRPPRIGPLPAGTILTADVDLNQEELSELMKMGVLKLPPGTNIPTEAVQKARAYENEPVVAPDGSKLNIPQTCAINELTPEKQESIKAAIAEMRGQREAPVFPEIQDSTEGYSQDLESPVEKAPEAEKPKKPEYCPHCGWDQANEDAEITDEDKLIFLQSLIGRKRFVKEYSLGGGLKIVLRTLTNTESDICWAQTAYDHENATYASRVEYFRTVNDYRLCLSIASIDYAGQRINLPELAGYKTDEPGPKQTKLRPIVEYIYSEAMVHESVRRACASEFFRFQRLVERLESHLHDPNFWPATEGQPSF